jgi:CO/xanthine dehydrogenase Mo-binding subunit
MLYTNTVPCGSYRAPGEPQAVFAVESHTDMSARAMGIDPYAFRLKNVVQEGDVSGTGQVFRHVRGAETLRRTAEAANWVAPKPRPGCGRGIAVGQRPQGRAVSMARVTVDSQGHVTLGSSVPDTGVASIPWGARWSPRIWASPRRRWA